MEYQNERIKKHCADRELFIHMYTLRVRVWMLFPPHRQLQSQHGKTSMRW